MVILTISTTSLTSLKMVRLVLLKLTANGFNEGLYSISTVENLKKHHTGNEYLNLHEKELDGSLLDILGDMESKLRTLYIPFGGDTVSSKETGILYVIDTHCTNADLSRKLFVDLVWSELLQ